MHSDLLKKQSCDFQHPIRVLYISVANLRFCKNLFTRLSPGFVELNQLTLLHNLHRTSVLDPSSLKSKKRKTLDNCLSVKLLNKQSPGGHHSLVDSSATTILQSWVLIPCKQFTLFPFIVRFCATFVIALGKWRK